MFEIFIEETFEFDEKILLLSWLSSFVIGAQTYHLSKELLWLGLIISFYTYKLFDEICSGRGFGIVHDVWQSAHLQPKLTHVIICHIIE